MPSLGHVGSPFDIEQAHRRIGPVACSVDYHQLMISDDSSVGVPYTYATERFS